MELKSTALDRSAIQASEKHENNCQQQANKQTNNKKKKNSHSATDSSGIWTHAGRAQWISNPSP